MPPSLVACGRTHACCWTLKHVGTRAGSREETAVCISNTRILVVFVVLVVLVALASVALHYYHSLSSDLVDSYRNLLTNSYFYRYVIVAADASAARSILVFKHDEDKIMVLDSHKLLAGAGTPADNVNFTEYVQKNVKLYELDNDLKLTTVATANFIRKQLADALRKGSYQTNLLLAGYDNGANAGPSLYFFDYLAAMAKVNFAAQGYAANFILSVFDRDWKENLTLEEGLEIVKKCLHELKTRFLISQPVFTIKVVDKDGCRVVAL